MDFSAFYEEDAYIVGHLWASERPRQGMNLPYQMSLYPSAYSGFLIQSFIADNKGIS